MRVVIQRVSEASVIIDNVIKGEIASGFMILLGIEPNDNESDIDWLTSKICGLRVFSDAEGLMNESIIDQNGEILLISQFTLFASTKKGNRPSFLNTAKPEIAIPLYENFVGALSQKLGKRVKTGEFGADMKVSIINDGPVTITIDSKNRE
ncbi:MAG: D-aminoacyl-tRNA deacylase [Leeuwenhoekiella sp.]|nr:D-aminoacyl-tRNA deacylase [Leeuwenhoekiella sp.]